MTQCESESIIYFSVSVQLELEIQLILEQLLDKIKNKKQLLKKPGQNRRSQRIRKRQREPYYLFVTLMIKLPPYFFVQRSATSISASYASVLALHSKCLPLYPFTIYCRFHQIYISRHLVIHQLLQRVCRLSLLDYFIDLFYFICFPALLGAIS